MIQHLILSSLCITLIALAGCGGAGSVDEDGSGTGVNLRITNASLSSSPGAPVKNTAVTVTVVVSNNGSTATPATTYSHTLNSTTVTTALPSVPAGGSITVTFDVVSVTAGTYPVTVALDPANAVNERSESDNSASVNITWSESSLRNIAISGAALDDATLGIGDDARITYTLTYNDVGLPGGPTVPVSWRIVRDDDGVLTTVVSGAQAVVVGTPQGVATVFDDPGISGTRNYILQVDPAGLVAESSETDNIFAFAITWSASG